MDAATQEDFSYQSLRQEHLQMAATFNRRAQELGCEDVSDYFWYHTIDLGPAGVTDLQDCGLHEVAVRDALPVLAEFIRRASLVPYDIGTRTGEDANDGEGRESGENNQGEEDGGGKLPGELPDHISADTFRQSARSAEGGTRTRTGLPKRF